MYINQILLKCVSGRQEPKFSCCKSEMAERLKVHRYDKCNTIIKS